MVLIFGWGAGEAQDLGEVAPAVCPNCHNHVYMHHIRSEKKVSLYFVPLIPYGTDEYLSCPICRHGLQVRPEQRGEVQGMQATTAQFRRGAYPADAYGTRVEHFWRVLGVGTMGEQVVHPSPSIPPPRSAASSAASRHATAPTPTGAALNDQLKRLSKLHASGALTDEEYAAAKRHVLGI